MLTTLATHPKSRATLDDYFALPEGALVQLIDGELVDMSPAPSTEHQEINANLFTLLNQWVRAEKFGKCLFAPVDVQLSSQQVLQPDLLVISHERMSIYGKRIVGAPDLVVEILSPSTATYDLTSKMRIYATAGVTEYWIVDPEDQTVRFYDNRQGTFAEFDYLSIHKKQAFSKLLSGLEVVFDVVFDTK